MNYQTKSSEFLKKEIIRLKKERDDFSNSDAYNWYLKNKHRKFEMIKHSKKYYFQLKKLEKIESYLNQVNANIDCIEYELYARDNYVPLVREK